MAQKACSGVIKLGGTPAVVGDLRAYRQNSEAAEIDTTIMGNCVSRFEPGPVRDSLEADMYFEPEDAGQALIITNLGGAAIAVEVYPFGEGSGNPVATATMYVMSRNVEAAVDGSVELAATFSSDESGLTWGTAP